MSPDLNSVPPSPHSGRHIPIYARAPESMAPPPPLIAVPGTNHPSQSSRDVSASVVAGHNVPAGDNTGVGFGPGTLNL